MTQPADGDEFRSHWFTFPRPLFLHDREPDGPPLTIELRPGGPARRDRGVRRRGHTRLGPAPAPTSSSGGPRRSSWPRSPAT